MTEEPITEIAVADGPSVRVMPLVDEQNAFFWTSGADGRLRFQRCPSCRRYVHPPSPVCSYCLIGRPEPEVVSGRGRLESFTVNYQQWIPGDAPYIVAWVSIVEQDDVRLTTNIVNTSPDELRIGMEVEAVFEAHGKVYLPLFRPVRGGSEAHGTNR
jgi:uncharacterized OB-fold protein